MADDFLDDEDDLVQAGSEAVTLCVPQAESGKSLRLDVFLTQSLSDLSRSRLQKLIEDKLVHVDGEPARAGLKLKGGEKIEVIIPPPVELDVKAQDIPLRIVFEDDYLAVVDKPIGMVTHPGAGVYEGTLVNALLHHMKGRLSGISGTLRPGIVHRLDKDTSGLLVVAKEDRTHRDLARQIKEKTAQRIYTALVEGVLESDSGAVNKPIGRHPVKRKQMAVVAKGKEAVSHFQVLRRFHKYTLVKVRLTTGRTHQIRVHMASLGHPVVGDLLYNNKQTGSSAQRAKLGLSGHCLHAAQLSFSHPITGQLLEFESPLPASFQALIDSLT